MMGASVFDDENKKAALLELFLEVVRATMDEDGKRGEAALEAAKAKGLTEADLEEADGVMNDPSEFRKVFGENAINEDLLARMRDYDMLVGSFGWDIKPFKGFYPQQ